MSKDSMTYNHGVVSCRGMRWWHLALFALTAVALVVGLYYLSQRRPTGEKAPAEKKITEVPEGSRAVTLFFADAKNEGLIGETREVAVSRDFTTEVKQIIEALLEGPKYAGVSAVPPGTRILDVFYDPEKRTLYLDFSSELVAGHPGGSSAEYFTIASIMRTISENLPEVEAVQFLVDGLQMGTIGGHIDADKPFLVRDWR